ncbi:U3 small nucleolar RNA-associated protein [Pycnococcus provasolii]
MIRLHRARMVPWCPAPVTSSCASSDGSLVAVARESGAVELYETSSWALLAESHVAASLSSGLLSLAFVEGRIFVGTVAARIFELRQGRAARPTDSRGGAVWGMAAEPMAATTGAQRVAAACDDGRCRVWALAEDDDVQGDSPALELAMACDPPATGRALCVAWSGDGTMLAVGTSHGTAHVYASTNGREAVRVVVTTRGDGETAGAAMTPTRDAKFGSKLTLEQRAAAARAAVKRDLPVGRDAVVADEIAAYESRTCVWCVAFTRDGKLAAGDQGGSVTLWDVASAMRRGHGASAAAIAAFHVHQGPVLCIAASRTLDAVFASGTDSRVALFQKVGDDHSAKWVLNGLKRPHSRDVRALVCVPPRRGGGDEEWLLSGGDDLRLVIAHCPTFLQRRSAFVSRAPAPTKCAVVRTAASSEGQLSVPPLMLSHDAESGQVNLFRLGAVVNENAVPESMRATEAGMEVVLARPPRHLLAINTAKRRCDVAAMSDISADGKATLALSSHEVGTRVLTLHYDANTDTAEVRPVSLEARLPSTGAVCVTSDGSRLVAVEASSGVIRIVDVSTGETVGSFFDFAAAHVRPVPENDEAGMVPRASVRRVVQSLNRATLMSRRERLRNHRNARKRHRSAAKAVSTGSGGSVSGGGSGDERYTSLSGGGSGGESDGTGGASDLTGDSRGAVWDTFTATSSAGLHGTSVSRVAVSTDGRWLACAGGGGLKFGPLAAARAVVIYDLKRMALHGVLPLLGGAGRGGDATVTDVAFGTSALLRAPATEDEPEHAATLVCVARASNAVHVYIAETLAAHPWCKHRPTPRGLAEMPGVVSAVSFRPLSTAAPSSSKSKSKSKSKLVEAEPSPETCDTLLVVSPAALCHVKLHPRGRVTRDAGEDDDDDDDDRDNGTVVHPKGAGSRRRRRAEKSRDSDGVHVVPLDEPCLFGSFIGCNDALLVEANFEAAVAASGAAAPATRKRFGE